MKTDREAQGAMALRSINRVPMIWSDPSSRTGKVTPALASTIEFSATILERAGVDPYFGMQGQSFLPCIHGANEHRNNLLIEFNDGFACNGYNTSACVRTIVNKSWQLSVYKGEHWGELYDIENDPRQTCNLWDSVEHAEVKAELFEALAELLIGQMDESPRSSRLA
jgi:arylsulfatase A-like enzyme